MVCTLWFKACFQYVPHTITHYSVGVSSLSCFDMVILFCICSLYYMYYMLFLTPLPLRLPQYVYLNLYYSFSGVFPPSIYSDTRYPPRISQSSIPYTFYLYMIKRTFYVLHRIHYVSLYSFFGLCLYYSP